MANLVDRLVPCLLRNVRHCRHPLKALGPCLSALPWDLLVLLLDLLALPSVPEALLSGPLVLRSVLWDLDVWAHHHRRHPCHRMAILNLFQGPFPLVRVELEAKHLAEVLLEVVQSLFLLGLWVHPSVPLVRDALAHHHRHRLYLQMANLIPCPSVVAVEMGVEVEELLLHSWEAEVVCLELLL